MVNSEYSCLNILREAKSTHKNAVVYFHRLKPYGISHEKLETLQQVIVKTEEIITSRRYGISEIELSGEIHRCILWGESPKGSSSR